MIPYIANHAQIQELLVYHHSGIQSLFQQGSSKKLTVNLAYSKIITGMNILRILKNLWKGNEN